MWKFVTGAKEPPAKKSEKDYQKDYELHRRTLLVESEPDLVDYQTEIAAAIEKEQEYLVDDEQDAD